MRVFKSLSAIASQRSEEAAEDKQMQQFIVPQFIDVEDKIFGPITVRQFVLMIIGGIVIFLSFRYGDISFFLFMTLITAGIVFLFGFLKVNGSPFHIFLLNFFTTLKKPNLRIWHRDLSDEQIRNFLKRPKAQEIQPSLSKKETLSSSRLAELSLIVDTRGEYKGEN